MTCLHGIGVGVGKGTRFGLCLALALGVAFEMACVGDAPPIANTSGGSAASIGGTSSSSEEEESTETGDSGDAIPGEVVVDNLPDTFEGAIAHCDLEGDGSEEIIVTLGDFDNLGSVLVVDGDGTFRWDTDDGQGGFAYPLCRDVDDDGVLDILTTGRTQDLIALSGVDGSELWRLTDRGYVSDGLTFALAEVRGDPRIFMSSGGGLNNVRHAGRLTVLDGDQNLEALWNEPDGAEIWDSPATYRRSDGTIDVAIGSGGETLPGNLYWLNYDPAALTFTPMQIVASACATGGFMASPVFADVDDDGEPELVAADACGRAYVVDRMTGTRWTFDSDPAAIFTVTAPLPVDLDEDGAYDLVFAFSNANPEMGSSMAETRVYAMRGSDGAMAWEREGFGRAIPAAIGSADLGADGREEIFVGEPGPGGFLYILDPIDGATLETRLAGPPNGGSPISDVDADGAPEVYTLGSEDDVISLVRHDFLDSTFTAARSYSGFRGREVHDGYRP